MPRSWHAHLLALLATLFALLLAAPAMADVESALGELPPPDVGIVVQPEAAALGDLPDDFQRIEAGWLVLEFPGSVRSRIEPLVREGEELRAKLSDDLGQPVLDRALVRVARDPAQMAGLAPRNAPPFTYASGMAYESLNLVLLSLQAPGTWEAPDLGETFRHELSHLALADAAASHHLPRWFDEGLAIQESGELWFARWKALGEASVARRLIPLAELDRAFPNDGPEVGLAYAESADVVRFLMRGGDRARFGSLVQRVRGGVVFDRALEDAYGTDARTLEYQWREEVTHHFGLIPALTGGGLLWTLIVALTIVAYVKKSRQAKAKLAQWAREEAEAQAALVRPTVVRATASPEAPEAPAIPASEDAAPARVPSVPVVEHEGRWYTLH
jgi:hypothetical protein